MVLATKLPPPLTPEERRIVKHVVFVGTWLTAMVICVALLTGVVQTVRAQYSTPDQRITALEVKAGERDLGLVQIRAEIALLRARQDEVIWGQQKMYGFAAGMLCIITILTGLTGANWLTMRKSK